MGPTAYGEVNAVLAWLLRALHTELGDRLLGLYAYGSLVWGDFDPEISDVDLLAVLESDPEADLVERLRVVHQTLVDAHPAWKDRIEVQYVAEGILRTFKSRTGPMAVISPGEPLHLVEANVRWLSNWYSVQERGLTLYGPHPRTWIQPVNRAEFLRDVRAHVWIWRTHVNATRGSRPYQSYAILTLCRAWLTLRTGRQASKLAAARWAQDALPHESVLIAEALRWRAEAGRTTVEPEPTYAETERFVHAMIDRIQAEGLLDDETNVDPQY